jgi:outer membrane protein
MKFLEAGFVATLCVCAAGCPKAGSSGAAGPGAQPRASAAASATPQGPPQASAGQLNVQIAVRESSPGKEAAGKLRTIFDDKQKQLDEMQEKWKQDHERLEKRKGVMSDAAYQTESLALQKRVAELQQVWLDFQKDLNEKDAQAVASLAGRARGCASQVGDALGLSVVYEKGDDTVLWSRGGKDASDAQSRAQPRWELTYDVVRCIDGAPVQPAKATAPRAGKLDMATIVTGSHGGLQAKEKLKQLHAQRQQELDDAQAVLTRQREQLESRKATMSAARFKKESDAFQAKVQQLHALFAAAQEELKSREGELVAPLMQKAKDCAARVGQAQGLGAIYEDADESVVWAKEGSDPNEPWLRRQTRIDVGRDLMLCVDSSP